MFVFGILSGEEIMINLGNLMALRVKKQVLTKILQRFASGTPSTSAGGSNLTPVPNPGTTSEKNLIFDEKTHTGQAWDQEDYRLVRFTEAPKQVNPNVAMHLIAQIPPTGVKSRLVSCDGGGGALGHPKIYINLDKPGNHACGYCGLRFFKDGQVHDGSEHIQV